MGALRTVVSADKRLAAVASALSAIRDGARPKEAMAAAGAEAGVSASTLYRWYTLVKGQPKAKWIELLDPEANYGHRGGQFSYGEAVYEFFKKAYLKTSPPSQVQAYSALEKEAKKRGWDLPSVRSLNRRMGSDPDIPRRTRYDQDY